MPIPYRPVILLPGDIQRTNIQAADDSEARRLAANQDQPVSPMDRPPQPQEQVKPQSASEAKDITKGKMSELSFQYRHATTPDGLIYTSPRTGKQYRVRGNEAVGGVAQWDPEITLEDTGRRVEPFSWRGIGDTTARLESDVKTESADSRKVIRDVGDNIQVEETEPRVKVFKSPESATGRIERPAYEEFKKENPNSQVSESDYYSGAAKLDAEKQSKALEKLEPYKQPNISGNKENERYNLAQALANNVDKSVLKDAGFNDAQIIEQEKYADYLKATPEGKFSIMVERGDIPKGSKFKEVDKDGNIVYIPPAVSFASNLDYKAYFDTLSSDKFTSMSPEERDAIQRQIEGERDYKAELKQMGKLAISFVPVVGTVVTWKDMSPTWRAISIAGDIAFLIPLSRATAIPRAIKAISKIPGRQSFDDIARTAINVERSTLKSVAGKEVAKAYSVWDTARVKYAENLLKIKELEKSLVTRARGSEVYSEIERALTAERKETPILEGDYLRAGDNFATAQRTAIGRQTVVDYSAPKKAVLAELGEQRGGLEKGLRQISKEISETQDAIRTKPNAEQDYPGVLRTLESQKADLTNQLGQLSRRYAEISSLPDRARVKMLKPGMDTELLKDFGKDAVRDTKSSIDLLYSDKIPDVKKVVSQINEQKRIVADAKARLSVATARLEVVSKVKKPNKELIRTLTDSVNNLLVESKYHTDKLTNLQSQYYIAKSAKLSQLTDKSNELIREFDQVVKDADEIKKELAISRGNITKGGSGSERDLEGILEGLESRRKQLDKTITRTKEEIKDAMKGLEIEWAEPIPRQGGSRGTRAPTIIPIKYRGGGGVRGETQAKQLIFLGAKPKAWDDAGNVTEWEVPGIKTIETMPGETVRVEPQPWWEGKLEVKTEPATKPIRISPYEDDPNISPAVKRVTEWDYPWFPQIEPVKRPPFDPEPGKITWTPSIVMAPKVRQATRTETGQKTEAEGDVVTEGDIASKTRTGTKTKTEAESKVSAESKTKTISKVSSRTEQKGQTMTRPLIKTQPATQVETQPATKTETATTTTTKTGNPPPKKPPPKIPPPLPKFGGKQEEEKDWTEKEIKSAIKWKDGFTIHALKYPYRRGVDEKSYNVNNLPPGLDMNDVLDLKGAGSQEKSVKVSGDIRKVTTVDVGNQDLRITRVGNRRVRLGFSRDTRGTSSQMTVQKHTISKKRGRVYHTNFGGSNIISRRPLGVY